MAGAFLEDQMPTPMAPDAVAWAGFRGKSSTEGYVRIYLAADQREYVELPEKSVVWSLNIGGDRSPLVVVWVEPNTDTRYRAARDVEHGFLKGSLTSRHLATVTDDNPFAWDNEIWRGGVFTAVSLCIACPNGTVGPCMSHVICDGLPRGGWGQWELEENE